MSSLEISLVSLSPAIFLKKKKKQLQTHHFSTQGLFLCPNIEKRKKKKPDA